MRRGGSAELDKILTAFAHNMRTPITNVVPVYVIGGSPYLSLDLNVTEASQQDLPLLAS